MFRSRPTVLDPQGQTIQGALNGLGHKLDCRRAAGQIFRDRAAAARPAKRAAREMDQIARDVLANPVIEDYRVEFFD